MDHTFLIAFFDVLNRQFNYAVLRGAEGLPEKNSGRDIDILVAPHEFKQILRFTATLAEQHHLKIFSLTRDPSFWSLCLGDSKKIFMLEFWFAFNIYGVNRIDVSEFLDARIFNGKIYCLPPVYSFCGKYIFSRSCGQPYPRKYQALQSDVLLHHKPELEIILNKSQMGRHLSYEEWESCTRTRLWFRSLSFELLMHPLKLVRSIGGGGKHWLRRLMCPQGMAISFSGPDGCGKTTVIELLRERLAVNPPMLFHFRPSLLPNLGEVAHKAGAVKEVDRNFDRPHRGQRKGLISSLIRLAYYSCDYVIGYAVRILPLQQRKHIVFFDRYFTDIIVDGERSSIFLNYRFLARLRHFIPGCQYNFLFRVDPERILNRKQELSGEVIERIYSRLEYLASCDGSYYWIDNNGTPEQAVEQILEILLCCQHRKCSGFLPFSSK